MSDRLRHLRRQQARLQEQLASIEAEIARETTPTNTTPTTPTPSGATAATSAGAPPPEADMLIEHYAPDERLNPTAVRRGCLLVVMTTLLLIACGLTAIWLVYYR